MSSLDRVLLFVLFQAGWFGSALAAQRGYATWTPLFPLMIYVYLFVRGLFRSDLTLVLLKLAFLGLLFDACMAQLGWIRFEPHTSALVPIWLISMWFLFVALLPMCLETFGRRWWLSALLGLIFGPLSYKAGSLFGIMFFQNSVVVAAYGAFWAIYFPLSLKVISKSQEVKYAN